MTAGDTPTRVTSSYHYRMHSGDVTWLKTQRKSIKCAMTSTRALPGRYNQTAYYLF